MTAKLDRISHLLLVPCPVLSQGSRVASGEPRSSQSSDCGDDSRTRSRVHRQDM